jgi:NADPH-dependent F420 reductase
MRQVYLLETIAGFIAKTRQVGSAAQEAVELVPQGVSVVAAFQNVGAEMLNSDSPVDCDVIVCSDDAVASQVVRNLAIKIPGVRALDGGKLENARILEQITALLIGLNIRHKGHSGIRISGLPASAYNSL